MTRHHPRQFIILVALLLLVIMIAETGITIPSYAKDERISTPSQSPIPTSTKPGRRGGVPPGLQKAWAHSNMSVVARAVTQAIFLGGVHGVELAEIAVQTSRASQMIDRVAFNESVVQRVFDRDGAVVLIINSSAKPTAVFADENELKESPSTAGLNADNETWMYNDNGHIITVFADPSSITLYYGAAPTPTQMLPIAYIGLILVVFIVAIVVFAASTRKRGR